MLSASELNAKGGEYQTQGNTDAARMYYLAALSVDPNYVAALINLAVICSEQEQLDAGVAFVRRAISVGTSNGNFYNILGNLLTRLNRFDEAEIAFFRAIQLSPELSTIYHNQALLFLRERKYLRALEAFTQVEKLGEITHGFKNDKAHALMYIGDLEHGLELYESRWDILPHLPPWDYHIPEWRGEDLGGKRILIHGEQGIGDTIMCARFFTGLKAQVVLGVPKSLERLFLAQDWGVEVLAIEEMNAANMSGFDFQSPMYSAMRWLGVRVEKISSKPYIRVEPSWKSDGKVHVGICWASGRRGTNMDLRRREIDLRLFLPLAEDKNFRVRTLQKGTNEEDVENIGAEGLIQQTPLGDWLDTARFIAGLDAVLTVDTAIAHLAGAMGKPTYMLAQFTNCWRWWNIDAGSGLPWYRRMKIYRQPTVTDWETPVRRAISDLRSRYLLRVAA